MSLYALNLFDLADNEDYRAYSRRSPDAALALYSKLRNASHLSVQVERRGEAQQMDYTIK